jgi:hypothetical protein
MNDFTNWLFSSVNHNPAPVIVEAPVDPSVAKLEIIVVGVLGLGMLGLMAYVIVKDD